MPSKDGGSTQIPGTQAPQQLEQHGRLAVLPRPVDGEIVPLLDQLPNARELSRQVHHKVTLWVAATRDIEGSVHDRS